MSRRRVERCINGTGYAAGWLVMRDDGTVLCWHDTHGDAVCCALAQVTGGRHGR